MEEKVDEETNCQQRLSPHLENDNKDQVNHVVPENNEGVKELEMHQDAEYILREKNKVKENPPYTEENLCGWLKLRSRGIGNLKGTKQRWFHYGEENCKLYCYSDPLDLTPLGEINIALASFYFSAGHQEKLGMFQIKADGKEVTLDAGSRQNMMFWLQALQSKRRQFNISRAYSSYSTESVGHTLDKRKSNFSGLVAKELVQASTLIHPEPLGCALVASDIPEIHIPDNDSHNGSDNSLSSFPTGSNKPFNIKAELQQMWSTLKSPGRFSRAMSQQNCRESVFYCDVNLLDDVELISFANTSISTDDGEESEDISNLNLCSTNESSFPEITENDESALPGSNSNQRCECKNSRAIKCSSCAIISKTGDEFSQRRPNPLTKSDKSQQQRKTYAGSQIVNDKVQKFGTNRNKSQNNSGTQGKLMSRIKKIKFGIRQHSLSETAPRSSAARSVEDSGPSSAGNQTNATDLNRNIFVSNKDVHDLEEEVKANREMISVLLQQVDELKLELQARLQAGDVSDEDKTNMLVERDKQLRKLQNLLQKSQQECSITVEKLRSTEAELKSSQDQLLMFQDLLKVKDEVVMNLTNQIFDWEQKKQQMESRTNSFAQQDVIPSLSSRDSSASLKAEKVSIRELESYKDMCQGYELQHKFLTKEILELNDLRKGDIAREKAMMVKFANLQAKYCQTKSKYYVLLKHQKELSPQRDNDDDQEVVNQLLEDALEVDTDDVEMNLIDSGQEYDRYGFSSRHFMERTVLGVEEDQLGNKAVVLERQSEELSNRLKEADREVSLRVKWENYMVGRAGKLQRSQELKNLIRQGVPHEYREMVWKGCINFYVGDIRERTPNFYQNLLQKKALSTWSDPSVKQVTATRVRCMKPNVIVIELDLLRTLPYNKHYESIESEGTIKLRNILLAFSEYNQAIGYCQGLNRLAAIALLFMSEEDAFWCLVAIVDYILPPDYFSTTLMAAQADQRVLKDLVQEKLPKIHQKLVAHNVDLSLFTFNWYLTIFVDNIPAETFLHIWDAFLYEGSKVLFRFAVAFLKSVEEEILIQPDSLQLNRCLRKIGENMTNIKQISSYAFNWVNPFSMKFIATRRQQHLHDVNLELEKLEKFRSGINTERAGQQADFNSDDNLDSFTN